MADECSQEKDTSGNDRTSSESGTQAGEKASDPRDTERFTYTLQYLIDSPNPRPIQKKRPFRERLDSFERHPFTKLIVGGGTATTLIATCIAVWATLLQLEDLQREQMARYWQLLTTKAAGNTGKVEALQWLFIHGVELVGLDLSCEEMGGADASGECKSKTYLKGLNIKKSPGTGSEFSGFLDGADLRGCSVSGVDVDLTIDEAIIEGCQFSDIAGEFTGSPETVWDGWGRGTGMTVTESTLEWAGADKIITSSITDSEIIFHDPVGLFNVDLSRSIVTMPYNSILDRVNLSEAALNFTMTLKSKVSDKEIVGSFWLGSNFSPIDGEMASTVTGNYFFEGRAPVARGAAIGQISKHLGGKLFECPSLPDGYSVQFDGSGKIFIRPPRSQRPNDTEYECVLIEETDDRIFENPANFKSLVEKGLDLIKSQELRP